MQRRLRAHAAKPLLTPLHPQTLIPNIDKDVVAAVEGAEGDAALSYLGRHLNDLLDRQDCFLELLAREAVAGLGEDAYGAFFAEDGGGEMEGLDAVFEGAFCDGEEGLDRLLVPGVHDG